MQYIKATTPEGGFIYINTDKIIAIEAMSERVIAQVNEQMEQSGFDLAFANVNDGGSIIHTTEARLVTRSSPDELLASVKALSTSSATVSRTKATKG